MILGLAPIVDFDGTIAHLEVDWSGLRARMGVESIDELWNNAEPGSWDRVTSAEIEAARIAAPVAAMVDALHQTRGFGVLTSNAEESVRAFVSRIPGLSSRLLLIVGRETLGGPKRDPRCFGRGYAALNEVTAPLRDGAGALYVGDLPWELRFARELGATALDVVDVERAQRLR